MRGFGFLICVAIVVLVQSCGLLKRAPNGTTPDQAIVLDTMELDFNLPMEPSYQIAPSKQVDVLHMELDISFGWEEQEVYGMAKLHIAGFGQPKDSVFLDARGFEIHSIKQPLADTVVPIDYTYDGSEIGVKLNHTLSDTDTAYLLINYTARPSKITSNKGSAITHNQGLYFVNPSGASDKPMQIWTQGEPESNSAWFPCVDHPHEKITHEIFITANQKYLSISNGKLVYKEMNEDGTVTSYWKQSKPHAVYLVMLAVGEFALFEDHWNDIPVNYYLDHEYLPYAKDIFGNTPEMLGFYSELLDYPYPWEKYHQIVVKDFVSGAMENTSAVIHDDFVQLTDRELLDESHEDVIAHELFHHWFGDLVTCESWTQLTLNEGFATYGEYLWIEHKYGLDEARLHLQTDLEAYLAEAEHTPKQLIRHKYHTPNDVFDSHTYQKGGRVLHMLRLELGDHVFFESIARYLKKHEYGSVEISDWRKSIEEVSGRDLSWFFDQWFERKGHPKMLATYFKQGNELYLKLEQVQDENWPTFKFHLPISIIADGSRATEKALWITQKIDTFLIGDAENTVIIDPYGDMLWEIEETKRLMQWQKQFDNAESFTARECALENIWRLDSTEAIALAEKALNDPFWVIRQHGLDLLLQSDSASASSIATVIELSQLDSKSLVRAAAFRVLSNIHPNFEAIKMLYRYGLKDKSFAVVSACLQVLVENDPCYAAENLDELINELHGDVPTMVSRVLARCAKPEYIKDFQQLISDAKGFNLFLIGSHAKDYAVAMADAHTYFKLGSDFSTAAKNSDSWWGRHAAIQFLNHADNFYTQKIERLKKQKDEILNDRDPRHQIESFKALLLTERIALENIQSESNPPFDN